MVHGMEPRLLTPLKFRADRGPVTYLTLETDSSAVADASLTPGSLASEVPRRAAPERARGAPASWGGILSPHRPYDHQASGESIN